MLSASKATLRSLVSGSSVKRDSSSSFPTFDLRVGTCSVCLFDNAKMKDCRSSCLDKVSVLILKPSDKSDK